MNMTHYCTKNQDGSIHVQNAIMGIMGQHHVHTPEDFKKWRRKVSKAAISWLRGTVDCDCGLKPGEVKNGRA